MTGFSQSYEDLIQYTFSPPTSGGPNYHNVARARSRGLEAEAGAEAQRVRVTASYTYLDTRVEDSGFDEGPGATFVEGGPLLRRPKHSGAATALIDLANSVQLEVSARRTGEREDRDFSSYPADPVVLPGYTVVDLSASFEVMGGGGRQSGTHADPARGESPRRRL